MKRREFIGGSIAALAVTQIPNWAFAKKTTSNDWLLVSASIGDRPKPTLEKAASPTPSLLRVFDSNFDLLNEIHVPFFAHSWVQNARDPNLIFGLTKWGNEAGIVDLNKKQFVGHLNRSPELRFFGHGLALPNGEMILSMKNDRTGFSELVTYKDKSIAGQFSTKSSYIHEIKFVPGQTDIIVSAHANGTGTGSVAWTDLKSKKILKEVQSNFRLPSHFSFLDDRGDKLILIGIGRKKPAVQLIDGQKSDYIVCQQKVILDQSGRPPETLNLALDPEDSNNVWIAANRTNSVLKLDLKQKKIVDVLEMPEALLAFTYDGQLYTSHRSPSGGNSVELCHRTGKTWSPMRSLASFGNSSHVSIIKKI